MALEFRRFWMVWRNGGAALVVRHYSKEAAENEAARLALKEPGAVFFVVKAVSGFHADIPPINTVKLIKADDIPF